MSIVFDRQRHSDSKWTNLFQLNFWKAAWCASMRLLVIIGASKCGTRVGRRYCNCPSPFRCIIFSLITQCPSPLVHFTLHATTRACSRSNWTRSRFHHLHCQVMQIIKLQHTQVQTDWHWSRDKGKETFWIQVFPFGAALFRMLPASSLYYEPDN